MSEKFTPTTEQVRDGYTARRGFMVPRDGSGETLGWWLKRQGDVSAHALKAFSAQAFDRWLAAHDAETVRVTAEKAARIAESEKVKWSRDYDEACEDVARSIRATFGLAPDERSQP